MSLKLDLSLEKTADSLQGSRGSLIGYRNKSLTLKGVLLRVYQTAPKVSKWPDAERDHPVVFC